MKEERGIMFTSFLMKVLTKCILSLMMAKKTPDNAHEEAQLEELVLALTQRDLFKD